MCELHSNTLHQDTLSSLPIPQLDQKIVKRVRRLKFWDVSMVYHCAALGTCLTLKELRQLGKKANVQGMEAWDDYNIHVSFLKTLDTKCYLSTLVNKLLDKKYKINILHFSKTKSEEDRMELWKEAVSTGDIAGAFWAILTHPDSGDDNLFEVYGKVHMLSHLSGATARIDLREFHRLEKSNDALLTQLNTNELIFNKKLEKKEDQLTELKIKTSQLQDEQKCFIQAETELNNIKNSPHAKKLNEEITDLKTELESTRSNTEHLEISNQKWEALATQELEKNSVLEQQLKDEIEEKKSIEYTLSNLLKKEDGSIDDCESCPNTNPDLCGRCVLYIGGRNSQYAHFRQLVEQQNGAFIHHDGGREDSSQKLASIVSRADVVVCPLDCVSHNAMNAVKRHCQINTKQLVFIPHASLSAFSKGLTEVMN